MKDLDEYFKLLEEFRNELKPNFIGPKSQILIEEAEKIVGLKFPQSYKTFIARVGHGGPQGLFIPGILADSIDELKSGGIVWGILNDRAKSSYPNYLIAIYDLGEGSTYCLDTSQMADNGECPVVLWPIGGYEQTPTLELVAEDLGKFLIIRLKEKITEIGKGKERHKS